MYVAQVTKPSEIRRSEPLRAQALSVVNPFGEATQFLRAFSYIVRQPIFIGDFLRPIVVGYGLHRLSVQIELAGVIIKEIEHVLMKFQPYDRGVAGIGLGILEYKI